MSDELAELRSHLPEYAGQQDLAARRLSDQHVRAWLGERLVALRDRVPESSVTDRLDSLILHCQFGDQRIIKAIESEHFAEPSIANQLDALDLAVVKVAERADDVGAATIVDYVTEVEGIIDGRTETILKL